MDEEFRKAFGVERERRGSGSAKVYCICRSSDDSTFMICCDSCDEWFHGACVKVTEEESKLFTKYFCPSCLKESNQPPCKRSGCPKKIRNESKYCSVECGILEAQRNIQKNIELLAHTPREELPVSLLEELDGMKEIEKEKQKQEEEVEKLIEKKTQFSENSKKKCGYPECPNLRCDRHEAWRKVKLVQLDTDIYFKREQITKTKSQIKKMKVRYLRRYLIDKLNTTQQETR